MPSGRVSVRLNRAGILHVTHVRLVRVGQAVLNDSARRVNVDTGHLRASRALEDHTLFVRVAYRAKYARFVHDGTKPHIIKAHPGGLLASEGHVFGTVVHHPGYRGNPFLTNAVRAVLKRYGRRP